MTIDHGPSLSLLLDKQCNIFFPGDISICQISYSFSSVLHLKKVIAVVDMMLYFDQSDQCIRRVMRNERLKGTNPALKKSSNIPEIYAKMFGGLH